MLGVYLSGTGNTKHCIEKLTYLIDENAVVLPLENENIIDSIKNCETIILGYPTQFSNAPIMVRGLWTEKLSSIPSYVDSETTRRAQNALETITKQLHACKVQGVLSLYNGLTKEEKEEFLRLIR